MIKLSHQEWRQISAQLKQDWAHKPSVFMLRDVMKRELGFTTRNHNVWDPMSGWVGVMYLDFYDDASETMFRLKYL
jgi:aminoglycoside/choline kinase family phosphotransferase